MQTEPELELETTPEGQDPAPEPTPEPEKDPAPEKAEKPLSAVDGAIKGARERLEAGEPIVPGDQGEGDATPEPAEEERAVASAAEEGAGQEAAEAEAEAPGEGEAEGEEPDGEEGAGEVEAEAEDEEEEETEAEGGEEEFVTFELPPRSAEGEAVPVEIPAELQEDFARLRNGYMRGEEARAVLEAAEAMVTETQEAKSEVEFIDRELTEDPVAFVGKYVTDPDIRRGLLLDLLADDDLWRDEELQENLRTWEHDEDARDRFRTKQENERLKKERQRETERRESEIAREGVRATAQEVLAIIPEGMDDTKRERFYRLSLNRLGELAYKHGRTAFSREEVVQYLESEGVLDGFGIDPQAARTAAPKKGAAAHPRDAGTSNGDRKKASAPPARARKADPEEARKTGERLVEGSKKRRAAAAYAPAGAGAPAAKAELPKGQSVKERIAYVRKVGMAQVLGE